MDNINITIKLFGGLDKYLKDYDHDKGAFLRLDSNETIIDILKKIGIAENRISLIMSDDKIISLNYVVKNNEIIKIYSQIGGG